MDNPTYTITFDELVMLRESNNIESEYGDLMLQQSIIAWDYLKQQGEITQSTILKLHKLLMLHSKLLPNEKGYFRDKGSMVEVVGSKRELRPYYAIQGLVDNWCLDVKEWYQNYLTQKTVSDKVTEEAIQQFHIRFEEIHPFIDGNGRTGRLLMNWQRLQCGLPLLTIREVDKQEYYKWFK